MEMRNCVIVEACRTAVGSMGGGLKPVSAYDMACCVMQGILDRSGIDPKEIDEVAANMARVIGYAINRTLHGDLPYEEMAMLS